MDSQPNPDIFFDSFYPDPRPAFVNYNKAFDCTFMTQEVEPQDSFFPETTKTFFNNFISNPLDVTRASTDYTETSDNNASEKQSPSPNQGTNYVYNIQDYNSNFGAMRKSLEVIPKNKFTVVLGANTGITFNGFNRTPELRSLHDQISSPFTLSPSFSEGTGNFLGEDNQQIDQNRESLMAQKMESLLGSKTWSEEKDNLLMKLASQLKYDWKKIAKRFCNKKITPYFLKNRFKELTFASLQRRVKFNHVEDLMIAKYFNKYGSNWGQMAIHFKNRSPIMLKNRYYSFIRKRNLLEELSKEVQEFEENNGEIDNLKDQESEKNFNFLNVQRTSTCNTDSSDQTNDNFYFEICQNKQIEKIAPLLHSVETANTFTWQINSKVSRTQSEVQSSAKEFEIIKAATEENTEGKDQSRKDEINALKTQVKSLRSLYLKTKEQLDKIRSKTEPCSPPEINDP